MPRHTKLNDAVQAQIVDVIREGNYATIASQLAGIDSATFWRWMERGANAPDPESNAYDPNNPEERFRVFRAAVLTAQAEAERDVVKAVRLHIAGGYVKSRTKTIDPETREEVETVTVAGPNGYVGLEYLSRTRRSTWAKPAVQKVELSGPGGGAVGVSVQSEALTALSANVAERLAALGGSPGPSRSIEPPRKVDDSIIDGELAGEPRDADE